jgi:ariadne-1
MDDEKSRERSALQKYAFYFERYQNNHIAMNSANKMMKEISHNQKDLAISLGLTLTQLEFTLNACKILIKAKRILKWSYAYGYYIENDLQRNLYEIIQQQLDIFSGELHVLMEKDFENDKKEIGSFTNFKDKVLSAMHKTDYVNLFLRFLII